MTIKLYNTLTKEKEEFIPIKKGSVGIYSCGPTVYNHPHIGNIRSYVFADILSRALKYSEYNVKHVINITDVGHLTSDEDEGEDKLELSARREGKTAQEIAEFYTNEFFENLDALNIDRSKIDFPKATDHIKEQIELIKKLEEKDFTYVTTDGVYFNTAKIKDYGKLAGLDASKLKDGARIEINPEKKNLTDFALWKFPIPGEKRQQEWESPWGVGFPGWHIECSAMSMKYLGEHFDIHTGGIDHIPVHHTNEIAQSEGATGKPFVNYWMHNGFVNVDGGKMAKSAGNFITLAALKERGFPSLAYRYWLLTADYKKPINFTWEALDGAKIALNKLYDKFASLTPNKKSFIKKVFQKKGHANEEYLGKFKEYMNDDLNTPRALALMWDMLKDTSVSPIDKKETLLEFDKVFGLDLESAAAAEKATIPPNILEIAKRRDDARKSKDWQEADKIRKQIEELGYGVKDVDEGVEIYKL